jgi:hypothetical protein
VSWAAVLCALSFRVTLVNESFFSPRKYKVHVNTIFQISNWTYFKFDFSTELIEIVYCSSLKFTQGAVPIEQYQRCAENKDNPLLFLRSKDSISKAKEENKDNLGAGRPS